MSNKEKKQDEKSGIFFCEGSRLVEKSDCIETEISWSKASAAKKGLCVICKHGMQIRRRKEKAVQVQALRAAVLLLVSG